MGKPILCVDFDGVIHSYDSGWKGADVVSDGPVAGAIAWLYQVAMLFDVQIYSSRSKEPAGIEAMRAAISRWEDEWRAQQVAVPRTCLALMLKFVAEKPAAFLMLDDRAICFEGAFPDPELMLKFRPWNKRAGQDWWSPN